MTDRKMNAAEGLDVACFVGFVIARRVTRVKCYLGSGRGYESRRATQSQGLVASSTTSTADGRATRIPVKLLRSGPKRHRRVRVIRETF